LIDHQFGNFFALRRHRNTRTRLVAAFAAAIEARRIDGVSGSLQARCNRLPDPAALIGAVNKDKYL
jgi:hypothetical protein